MLADIYDGRIWKNFPDVSDVPYFTSETADSHLGIMMNLDWFQPFDSSMYSCGAIYGVICNIHVGEIIFQFRHNFGFLA